MCLNGTEKKFIPMVRILRVKKLKNHLLQKAFTCSLSWLATFSHNHVIWSKSSQQSTVLVLVHSPYFLHVCWKSKQNLILILLLFEAHILSPSSSSKNFFAFRFFFDCMSVGINKEKNKEKFFSQNENLRS